MGEVVNTSKLSAVKYCYCVVCGGSFAALKANALYCADCKQTAKRETDKANRALLKRMEEKAKIKVLEEE